MPEKLDRQKFQEMQVLEQNLQNLLMQKQAFQLELSETQNALKELEKSGEDVFKIIGQLMLKTDKEGIKEELINKEKILSLRLKAIEKQEESFIEKSEKLRQELIQSMK
ncbi:MAG: prefoldin subunit [Nanoarchaeota archaeon]|nr:prefoldin subunit [Nanoarchaeota archaeon]